MGLSRKEESEFDKTCAVVGTAALLLRQRFVGKGQQLEPLLVAALDAAAVQLLLLLTEDPISDGSDSDLSSRLSSDSAAEGIRIFSWDRLVAVRAVPALPLLMPDQFGELVGADRELVDTFVGMADEWNAFLSPSEGNDKTLHHRRFTQMMWHELQSRVLETEQGGLAVLDEPGVASRLAALEEQTRSYFWALAHADQLPRPNPGATWYYERFVEHQKAH